MKKIGITTTVPIEVIFASGNIPIDLNNLFVVSENYLEYIDLAEKDGFPKSSCAWIKGIYGACIKNEIKEIIGVVEGDCSNTRVLIEVLQLKGVKVHPFSYPHSHDLEDVQQAIKKFMQLFDVDEKAVEEERKRLNHVRDLVFQLDELTYKDNKATGFENHINQLCMSDFNGDVDKYEKEMNDLLIQIKRREPSNKKIRLGYIGVPPMTGDIYQFVERFNAHFVFNEVQREFAFPRAVNASNVYKQYYDYTYPYDVDFRLKEIVKQIEERKIDGIIHYTQAFCHRAIEDIIIKNNINIPILTIEGDKLNSLDARTKLRLEAFLDMLNDQLGV